MGIEKPIHEDITYEDIFRSEDNLWNFLFFTGYLRLDSKRLEGDTRYITMKIPNTEVRYIYKNTIREWFGIKVRQKDLSVLYQADRTERHRPNVSGIVFESTGNNQLL